MRRRFVPRELLALVALAGAGLGTTVRGGLTAFPQDLSGFNTAANNPAVQVDFDSTPAGTSVSGQTLAGATFTQVGADLLVVSANDTSTSGAYNHAFDSTNRLIATSGANALSPGGIALTPGPNPPVEDDSLRIDFVNPVSSFGFDLLSQRADGFGFVNAQVLDGNGQELFTGNIPISALPAGEGGIIPGGTDFWGIVSDTNNIKTIILSETDSDADNADNNVGYDTFRFATGASAAIPLPVAVAAFPLLAAVAFWARKRMH